MESQGKPGKTSNKQILEKASGNVEQQLGKGMYESDLQKIKHTEWDWENTGQMY